MLRSETVPRAAPLAPPAFPEGVPPLTIEDHPQRPSPSAFGPFRVSGVLGEGHFGPVFLAVDVAAQRHVVVRTFSQQLGYATPLAIEAALQWLCTQPLEHTALAQPLSAGREDDVPFLAAAYVPGVSLDVVLQRRGPQPLLEILPQLTAIAGALDFAAAVGVHHGRLDAGALIVGDEGSGVVGLGIQQALSRAGAWAGPSPTYADDIAALASVVFDWLGRPHHGPLAEALMVASVAGGSNQPATALQFVAMLQPLALETDAPIHAPDSFGLGAAAAEDDEGIHEWPLRFADEYVGTPAPVPAAVSPVASTPRPAPRRSVLLVLFALAIGLAAGFASGFVVGDRGSAPAVLRPAATAGVEIPRPAGSATPVPIVVGSLREPVVRPPETQAPPPAPVPRRTAPAAEDRQRATVGTLVVVSRPAGAQVFLDERLVGTTPLSVSNVLPGRHAVRLELRDHRPWSAVTDVVAGTSARVAASLEQ